MLVAQRLAQFLLVLILTWLAVCVPVNAQEASPGNSGQLEQALQLYDIIPNWNEFTLSDFGSVDTSGSLPRLNRSWQAGDALTEVLTLGDVADAIAAEEFSLRQIGEISGFDANQIPLDSFSLLTNQELGNLVEAVPNLGNYSVQEVEPVQELLIKNGLPASQFDNSIASVLSQYEDFQTLHLNGIDTAILESFSVGDIPNADITALLNFEGWTAEKISEIPGLSDVPLGQMPSPLAVVSGIIARLDMIYGPAESDRVDTVSGSYQAGFEVPCPEGGLLVNPPDSPVVPAKCAYIELDDIENVGRAVQLPFEGKQWISGKYQQVEGGYGTYKYLPSPLGYVPGFEPTGRHPFGPLFKHVIWEPDETQDTATSYFFFRICDYWNGCTPYNQFRVPFLTYPINSYIFVGLLDSTGGGGIIDNGGGGGFPGAGGDGGGGAGGGGGAPCSGSEIGGVNVDALGESIASVESLGSGGHSAVGVYTCADGGTNCGRGLGKYQTMSYKESVQAVVGSRPGGQAWLNSIEQGHDPSEQEMMTYYPPEAQEQVYQMEIETLMGMAQQETDPTTGQPFTGGRLIERVAQMWYGGPYSEIDSPYTDALGRLSGYEYGREARGHYESISGKPTNCAPSGGRAGGGGTGGGQPTGSLANPVPGSVVTSEYGMRVHPVTGEYKMHTGVDISLPQGVGTPIQSADGGRVDGVSYDPGYGNFVVVDHGNGTATLYAHLDSVSVKPGDTVAKGQSLGAGGMTGTATGPHLHFEVIEGYQSGNVFSGQTVDPRGRLPF